jgi:signal transduction histidine kinase
MTKTDQSLLLRSWRSWLSNDLSRVGPGWLQLVWTLLFCLALAAVFTVLGFLAFARSASDWQNWAGWRYWYGQNLINCLIVGYLIHGLFEFIGRVLMGRERLRQLRGWRQSAYFAGIPLLGVALGMPVAMLVSDGRIAHMFSGPQGLSSLIASFALSLVISLALHFFFSAKARQIEAEKQAAQAQLRLLQGQMEPHFLFNTLATVQSLMDDDPQRARQMLSALTNYLRASLGQMRSQDSTLGDELNLARSFLALMQHRMEDRLAWHIEIDEALLSQPVPPWLLQPLVENAVHHGLEPKIDGGTVRVQAQRTGDTLTITIDDDGLGLAAARPSRGAGLALANLRKQLAARHGDDASLALQSLNPGTRTTVQRPFTAHRAHP